MSAGSILIVEDEEKIATVLRDYLENAGYATAILSRGDEVLPFVRKTMPRLIVLDLMLPGKDGTDICRDIRRFSDVPILMLTARVDEIDRIIGLEIGADDYICKPFSPREVVARVKAVLRRLHGEKAETVVAVGPISLNIDTHEAAVEGATLDLTPSEFELLRILMAAPNRVYSRNELLNRVQGYEFEGYDRTIDTHVKNLRKKIKMMLPGQTIIQTVYGVGYKLIPPEDDAV